MKTQRRHELQTNALADRLGTVMVWVEDNYKTVLGVVVAIAVIIGVYVALSRSSAAKVEAGWNAYFAAQGIQETDAVRNMGKVAEDYAGTDAGNWARLWLGDRNLQSGVQQLFEDRAQGNDELRKAVANYEMLLKQKIDPLLEQRARFGLARAYESLDRLEDARKVYTELADKAKWDPDALFAKQAEARLADLGRPQVKEFYDWFASQDPRPSLQGGLGDSPFNSPSFDTPLPEEPGSLGPSAFDSIGGKTPDGASSEPAATTPDASAEPTEPSGTPAPGAGEPPAAAPETPPADPPATSEEAPAAPSESPPKAETPPAPTEPAPSTP